MADRYYVEDITAVPFRLMKKSLSQMVPGPLALATAAFFRLRGILHWPLRTSHAIGDPRRETAIDRNDLPPRAVSRWAPLNEQLLDLGFELVGYRMPVTIGSKEHVTALYLDAYGTTVAILEWTRMPGVGGLVENTPLEFNSYTDVGPQFLTGVAKPDDLAFAEMFEFDSIEAAWFSNKVPMHQVYEEHQDRISGQRVYQLTPETALDTYIEHSQRRFDHMVKIGLMRFLSDAEARRLGSSDLDE